jgi:Ser/Thr protein kinase RdoA (MazF antagonist)
VKTSARNYYLKVYRPPESLESAEAEASLVWALSSSGVNVVKPVPRRNGQYAIQVVAPEGIRPMLLYEEAPPPLPKELDDELLSQIGENVALMHDVADKLDTSFDIPEIDLEGHLQERVFFTSQYLSDDESSSLEEISIHLKNLLQKQSRTYPDFGLCHADLVLSNIRLTEEGEVTFFDFGNALKVWRAYELAIVYWSLMNRYEGNGQELWEAFLQGYKSNRPLPELILENIAALLVLRQIEFLGGNCATLPLRLGTEPLESGFIEREMMCLKQLVEESCVLTQVGNGKS